MNQEPNICDECGEDFDILCSTFGSREWFCLECAEKVLKDVYGGNNERTQES
jgi:hypothetical protein